MKIERMCFSSSYGGVEFDYAHLIEIDYWEKPKIMTKELKHSILHLEEVADGVYTFGSEQKEADSVSGTGAGYMWSSRADVMNYYFNLNLIDVIIEKPAGSKHYIPGAVSVRVLREMLPKDYYIHAEQENNCSFVQYWAAIKRKKENI